MLRSWLVALVTVAALAMGACATIPSGRYGVDKLELEGVQQLVHGFRGHLDGHGHGVSPSGHAGSVLPGYAGSVLREKLGEKRCAQYH